MLTIACCHLAMTKIIDVQGGYKHGKAFEKSRAWPTLQAVPAPLHTHKHGMPDDGEIKKGLDKINPQDAAAFSLSK